MARKKILTEPKKPTQRKSNSKKPASPAGRDFIYAVGKRKEAVARVRLYPNGGSELKKSLPAGRQGDIIVNGKKIEDYFPHQIQKTKYQEPLHITNTLGKYTFTVKISGGGISSQLDALVLGISRVLSKFDSEKYRSILRKKGFLTRDARVRERRKVGMGGKSRRKRQSPKR